MNHASASDSAEPFAAVTPVEWFDMDGARCGFTSRAQGNLALHVGDAPEAVLKRRRALETDAGTGTLVFMNQTHSTLVAHVTPEDAFAHPAENRDPLSVDALVSETAPLAVLVADCLPVLFTAAAPPASTGQRPVPGRAVAVAAAHAGRVGLLGGILPNTVEELRRKHPEAAISAAIGPAVCGRCYEVPEDMAAASEEVMPGIRTVTRWGTPGLDLKLAARTQLESLGVAVRDLGICTLESEAHSSHRRDPSSGRIAGVIVPPAAQQRATGARRVDLEARLTAVRDRIERATAASGRESAPELVVVTKNFPASDAVTLAELGAEDMGENRDQEAAPKAAVLRESLAGETRPRWHFIGQLQTNKAKSVVTYASAVHSVDRLSLVTALEKAMAKAVDSGQREGLGDVLDVLIQVNLDPEASSGRGGALPSEVDALARAIAESTHLQLRGLMAVAPLGGDPDEAFQRLSGMHDTLREEHPQATWLSAGMSQDLEAAVRAGATHVRIGSDVLGRRSYVG